MKERRNFNFIELLQAAIVEETKRSEAKPVEEAICIITLEYEIKKLISF